MRTTLSLDDDVAVRLAREQRKRRLPFRQVVNDVLRAGLDVGDRSKATGEPFRTTGFDLGPSLIGSLDNTPAGLRNSPRSRPMATGDRRRSSSYR